MGPQWKVTPRAATTDGKERFHTEYRRLNLTTVLYALLLASTVVSLVAIFGPWLEQGTRFSVPVSCVVYLALIWLNKKGYGSVAGVLAILTLMLVANYGLSIGLGFRDESMLIFPGVLIFSSLILNRAVYIIVTVVVITNVVVVGVLDVHGYFMHGIGNTANYGEVVTAAMILGGTATSVYLLIKSLFRSLRRAESSRYRFQSIFDSSPNGVVIMDFDGRIRQINRKAALLFQRERDDILSRNFSELIRESDADHFSTLVRDLEAGIGPDREFEIQIVVGGDQATPVQISGWLVIDPESNPLAVGVFLTDVTETRELEAEKSTLEKQLFRAQKVEAIGTLAGGIAHDFNNILVGILGFAELAAMKSEDNPVVNDYLTRIGEAGLRAKALVQQILRFSRHEKGELGPISLTGVTKEVLKLVASTFPATTEIQASYPDTAEMIRGDGNQIHQVVMNLVTNALHALPDDTGHIDIRVDPVSLEYIKRTLNMVIGPGNYVRLRVTDDGVGVSPKNLEKIFEPYFTTKKSGEGTGLGLAVSMGIIKNHGGLIEVESTPGGGTTISVYFPELNEQATEERPRLAPHHQGNGERVLVVDDENYFVSVMSGFLESMNYVSTVFNDGLEALKELKQNPSKYQLVITDLSMPGMTGIELISEMKRFGIKVPTMLCTGFSEEVSERNFESFGIRMFLLKPVSRSDLEGALAEVFG